MPDEKKTIHCIRRMAAAVPVTLCSCGVGNGSAGLGRSCAAAGSACGYLGDDFLLKEKLEAELKMPSTAEKGKEIQAEVTSRSCQNTGSSSLLYSAGGKQADRGELHTGADHVCTGRRKWQK